jgi:ribosomal-protein-alanine N-acetyltransferase
VNTITQRAMRWWDIEPALAIERDLFGDEAWSPELFWSELAEHDTRHYLVVEVGGEIVGYGGLCVYVDNAFVQTIAIAREHQGRGLGRGLLTSLLDEAQRRGRTSVGLEVRADNDIARGMYERFGFVEVGRRRAYYQPSGTDAIVMIREGATR